METYKVTLGRTDELRSRTGAEAPHDHSGMERAVLGRPPEITLARGRRHCSTCMWRKTRWVVTYGRYNKQRVCWYCMDAKLRAQFREGY